MADVVRVPVLADGNAGFGNAINVMRLVRELEAAGAGGVCIEDNPFPKRCSLYEGWRRELVPAAEMAGKVRAAQAAKRGQDFVVVARIESLIADEGVDVALERAEAYAKAGADALLVHGRQFESLARFTDGWRGGLPLIAVPTLYPHVDLADLARAGFRAVIFPNQAVRAAASAMRSALQTMLSTGRCGSVSSEIAPLSDIEDLVGLDDLREAEAAFAAVEAEPARP
jgi:phosphoenolpyruvate phosphomutase